MRHDVAQWALLLGLKWRYSNGNSPLLSRGTRVRGKVYGMVLPAVETKCWKPNEENMLRYKI